VPPARATSSGPSSRASASRSPSPRSPSGWAAGAGSAERREAGDVFALNGDELLDVDFQALLAHHERGGAAATITVARPPSPFGLVDLGDDDVVVAFREAGRVPYWVNCGVYVLAEEALARLPEQGDHETTTFPELVAEHRLRAFRHEGLWLTVNTPKDLRRAEEQIEADPQWLAPIRR
jgi:NDP-sugar pyrophosphorylase family protein